jgi:hypothetical protein
MDWDRLDTTELFEELRRRVGSADGERMVWAFERALDVARIDEHLLDYLLVAAVCLVAGSHGSTPRTVLEQFFRRSVSDDEWRAHYAPLLA